MTMTDPIADMLTRLRNASQAYHDVATMPHSVIKTGIAEILTNEGYIAGYEVRDAGEGQVGKTLSLTLKYGQNRERSLAGVRRISKPGRGSTRVHRPAEGPGRPRHRDHLDFPGPADRQAGAQHRCGRRSRRVRVVSRQKRG
jgi:ribosomal protein S8